MGFVAFEDKEVVTLVEGLEGNERQRKNLLSAVSMGKCGGAFISSVTPKSVDAWAYFNSNWLYCVDDLLEI